MHPILRSGSYLALALALAGCVSVPRPAVREDGTWCFQAAKQRLCTANRVPSESVEADAKSFRVVGTKHTVWLVRNGWWDTAERVKVFVGGVTVETIPRTAVKVELPPGQALINVESNPSEAHSKLNLPSSSLSFVSLEREWGLFSDRYALKVLDETEGKTMVKRSKLISINDASNILTR